MSTAMTGPSTGATGPGATGPATTPTRATRAAATRTSAPLGRVLGAELRWVLRRPRTLVVLGLLALVPLAIAIGVATTGGPSSGRGPGLVAQIAGNGFVLPVVALGLSLALLLPLAVASAAADAVAGEAATGTLRGLLIAPVGRLRLVVMKSAGVITVAVIAVLLIAVVGMVAGTVVVGGAQGTLVTLWAPPSASARRWAGSRSSRRGRSGSCWRSAPWPSRSRRSPSTRSSCSPRCSAGSSCSGCCRDPRWSGSSRCC